MSATLLALILVFLSASASVPIHGDPVRVTSSPIEHFQVTGTKSIFGKLEFRGGLVISSRDRTFGGLSGIQVLNGGREAVIASDRGYLLRAELSYRDGRLASIAFPAMMRVSLPDAIRHVDIEDLDIGPDGKIHLALERNRHQIAALDPATGTSHADDLIALPHAGEVLGFNSGIESIAIFPEGSEYAGRMIAIGERPDEATDDHVPCWIVGAGRCAILARGKYQVTSARFLDDGDLLILERKFPPGFDVGMRLRRIERAGIGVGKVMDGETLIEAGLAMQIDNMEGLALHRDSSGATILTLISDDNLNFFQRTLILQFALEGQASE